MRQIQYRQREMPLELQDMQTWLENHLPCRCSERNCQEWFEYFSGDLIATQVKFMTPLYQPLGMVTRNLKFHIKNRITREIADRARLPGGDGD